MNNLLKSIFVVILGFVSLVCISCGKNEIESNEKITQAIQIPISQQKLILINYSYFILHFIKFYNFLSYFAFLF